MTNELGQFAKFGVKHAWECKIINNQTTRKTSFGLVLPRYVHIFAMSFYLLDRYLHHSCYGINSVVCRLFRVDLVGLPSKHEQQESARLHAQERILSEQVRSRAR